MVATSTSFIRSMGDSEPFHIATLFSHCHLIRCYYENINYSSFKYEGGINLLINNTAVGSGKWCSHCCSNITSDKGSDRCVHLSFGLNTIPASCPVSHIAHIQSHTPPLCLPSSSWHSGVISSSQLLLWRTTDWTSSCWGLQQHLLLYHLQIRASGNRGQDKTYGFSSVFGFPLHHHYG